MIIKVLDQTQLINLIRTNEITVAKTHIQLNISDSLRIALLSAIVIHGSTNVGDY